MLQFKDPKKELPNKKCNVLLKMKKYRTFFAKYIQAYFGDDPESDSQWCFSIVFNNEIIIIEKDEIEGWIHIEDLEEIPIK